MEMKSDASTGPHCRQRSINKASVERLPLQDRINLTVRGISEINRAIPNTLDGSLLIRSEIIRHRIEHIPQIEMIGLRRA